MLLQKPDALIFVSIFNNNCESNLPITTFASVMSQMPFWSVQCSSILVSRPRCRGQRSRSHGDIICHKAKQNLLYTLYGRFSPKLIVTYSCLICKRFTELLNKLLNLSLMLWNLSLEPKCWFTDPSIRAVFCIYTSHTTITSLFLLYL